MRYRRLLLPSILVGAALMTSSTTQATTPLIVPLPGLSFVAANDPTGNGMESVEILFKDENGTLAHSGVYVQRHNSAGIRVVVVPAPHASGAYFELDPSNDHVVVVQ